MPRKGLRLFVGVLGLGLAAVDHPQGQQGVSRGVGAAAVGHSDTHTTLGYLTNDARAERDVAARVGAALGLGELAESA